MQVATLELDVELYGGSADGKVLTVLGSVRSLKESDNKYRSLERVNKYGREMWYCYSGGGKLKRKFFDY